MNKLSPAKIWWIALIGGVTVGMGNGSVFGAALMCTLGRGKFEHWGGFFGDAYNPVTFQGFVDWCMLVFGAAFTIIMLVTLRRHGDLEKNLP